MQLDVFSPRRLGLKSEILHMGYVGDKWALRGEFFPITWFSPDIYNSSGAA
jgi:hypothetical protein